MIKLSLQPLSLAWKLKGDAEGPYPLIESGSENHSVVSYSLKLHGLCSPWNSLGQNTGVGSFSLLQTIFPTQGLNPGLPHCRWILYQLNHKGSKGSPILSLPVCSFL